jgi:Concanavalin A-like lectin/glucanases superfamily/TIR domain
MHFDVFISYPQQDKAVADAACARLEADGIRCWIAPRDVPPGADWPDAIVDAIDHCCAMVLIFSSSANASKQVHREVRRAFEKEVPVIPLRIEKVTPERSLAFFMGSVHWLDALSPPIELHLQKLVAAVKPLVGMEQRGEKAAEGGGLQKGSWPPFRRGLAAGASGVAVFAAAAGIWFFGIAGAPEQRSARPSPPLREVAARPAASTLENGLVGYWPFDSKTINWATNTAQDLSGHGNNATLVNMSAVKSSVLGKIGEALQFDGSSTFAKAGNANLPAGTAARSISVWIKTTQGVAANTFPLIAEYGITGTVGEYYGLGLCPPSENACNYAPAGVAGLGVWGPGITSARPINDGSWHHLVATFDGVNHRLYLDGVLQGTAPLTTNTILNTYLFIGGPIQSVVTFFNGSIDELRIYDRALSAQEVSQLFSN